MIIDFNLEEIEVAAKVFLSVAAHRKVIAFHGAMGAGKTTFIKAVCKGLNVKTSTGSPTFSIINEYLSGNNIIYHMDLYRLKNEKEAVNTGVEDALYSGDLCLVEWPENAPGIFPADTVHCYLTSAGHITRKLKINL